MNIQQLIGPLFQLSIVATVFGYGLHANQDDILYVLRRPRLLVVSLLAMFIVMPVVALALELYLDLSHAMKVALVVLALTPISQTLPTTEISSGGRASYAYGLSFAIAVLGTLLIPALIEFLGRVMSRPFGVQPGVIATYLLGTVLAPVIAGLVVQRFLPRLAQRIREPMVRAANIVLLVALVVLLISVFPVVLSAINLGNVLAISVFIAAGLSVGHFMGGPDPDHSVVLAIACASRNPGLAIGIAAANFPNENFAAAIILYALLVGIVSKPYINWQKRRLAATQQTEPGGVI